MNSEYTDNEFKKNDLVIREQQVVASFQRRLMYQVSKSRIFCQIYFGPLKCLKSPVRSLLGQVNPIKPSLFLPVFCGTDGPAYS